MVDKDVLITGPNRIPLLEGIVKEFASFIEWIFHVKLKKDDKEFIHQVLIEEWSRNDQLAVFFQVTCTLLQQHFTTAARSDTRDYWRQALMYDLDLTGFGSMPSALHKIGERLKVKPAQKRLRPTEEIASAFGDLVIFITRKVYGIQKTPPVIPSPSLWTKAISPWEKAFAASSDELINSLILRYLMGLPQMEVWSQYPEADRTKWKQLWVQDQILGPWLEITRRALLSTSLPMYSFFLVQQWYEEVERLAIQQSTKEQLPMATSNIAQAPNLDDAMLKAQEERNYASSVIRWNEGLITATLNTFNPNMFK